jgi:hypothetical protein
MDIDVIFSQARELARQGDRPAARRLLEEILQEDPTNEDVLLWHALVSPTKAEAIEGLKKVLEINPDNTQAQQRLEKLQAGSGVPAASPSNSTPFSYEPTRSEESPTPAPPATFTEPPAQNVPAAFASPSTPLDAPAAVVTRDNPALLKRLDHLITLQEHMDQQINKINRVAQYFFWLSIIGFVLSLVSICLAVAGVIPLLSSAGNLVTP